MVGRGFPAQEVIVNIGELMSEDQILEESTTLKDLEFKSNLECIQWLAKRRLLRNGYLCKDCEIPMSFVKRGQLTDGYRWKCKWCDKAVSIRSDSLFSRSRLLMDAILTIIYSWCRDLSQKDAVQNVKILEQSRRTLLEWGSFCRSLSALYQMDYPIQIGGLNSDSTAKVVDVDETLFLHCKRHRGKCKEGNWVFGGVERDTQQCFVVDVSDKSAETLSTIIKRHILPGSIIVYDGRRGYNDIANIENGMYEYRLVDSRNARVHKENVENLWMRVKQKLRYQFDTSEAIFQSYLQEFMWKNKYRENTFAHFLICARRQYLL